MTPTVTGLLAYLGITFSLAWGWWFLISRTSLTGKDGMAFQLAIAPGAMAPAVAAALVRGPITQVGFTVAEFIPKIDTMWPYYLVGLFAPLGIALASYGLARITGAARHADEVRPIRSRLRLLATLPLAALVVGPLQFGEEFGWRAFFQVRLFPSWPLIAAIITGLIWALWHFPLHRMEYGYPTEPWKGEAAFALHCILQSIFYGWIYARTGDIWAVSIAHMANNAVGCSAINALLPGKAKRHILDYEGVLSAIPLGIVCLVIVLTGGLGG